MQNPNHTIIVNWKKRGFGCAKSCTYCNWRSSPFLPNGAQGQNAVSKFIAQCKKAFITISGGADPLYKIDENRDGLLTMIETIKAHGFHTRLITRETSAIASLKGYVQQVSISLDQEVMRGIEQHRSEWQGLEIEYSLVLPPLPQAQLVHLVPQYAQLQRRLGGRLLLRENLNSIFPIDHAGLTTGHRELVVVPKKLCLQSRYLLTQEFWGHEIIQDTEPIMKRLMSDQSIFIFGGAVKHLLAPEVHTDFSDIDLITTSGSLMEMLEQEFAYTFRRVNPIGTFPHYYIGQSTRAGKPIQIVRVNTKEEAQRFVFNGTFSVDRVLYSDGGFQFDPSIGEAGIRADITHKRASHPPGPTDHGLFTLGRDQIEAKHRVKLIRKGFSIPPLPIS